MSDLLNFAQAAERLNVKESWLRSKVAAQVVPHVRLGRHVRFSEANLAQIVADAEKPPLAPRRRLGRAS